ncbi:MAG: hypothetical protein CUN55_05305, partial [Phototrophicales bacterium]
MALAEANAISLDYYKVGPWIGYEHMMFLAKHSQVLLHCNDSVVAYHLDIHKVAKLAQQTRTPWLSLHL